MIHILGVKVEPILLGLTLLFSCSRDASIPEVDAKTIPDYFPEPVYQFTNNPKSQQKYELGRSLFYDPVLSVDSSISCASCHDQGHAFADHNVALSMGVNGVLGMRNSPVIFNVLWQKEFMADGGINHIEVMPLAPLIDPLEMNNNSMADIISRLNANQKYSVRFKDAFGKANVDDQQLFFALAQYMAEINSYQSKYDEVRHGNAQFTVLEKQGYNLFKTNCAVCHQEPLFTDLSYRNNGIDSVIGSDKGRFRITQENQDIGKFKVSTLRNIDLTYPYMHDGRYRNLMDVLNHYTQPKSSATRDPILEKPIVLDFNQKTAIVAFLKTLTDYELLVNPKLNEPKP